MKRFILPPYISPSSALTIAAAVFATAMLFAALAHPTPAGAQTADTPTPVPTAEQPDGSGAQDLPPIKGKLNPPKYPNMDSNLNRIVEQVETGRFTAQAAAASAPVHRQNSVAVTLYIIEGYADAVAGFLEAGGASPRNIGVDYIEAYIPVSLLPAASQQEGVISIRTIIPPQPAQGAVVSEGVAAHGATAWHDAGLKGQGIKIGVIDVSFKGFADLMGTELPSTVRVRCYTEIDIFTSSLADCVSEDIPESSRFHGTAVTEAIFDIAPEAEYYIANIWSWGDLRDAVDWMVAEGFDVINVSVGFAFSGPGDGTTPFTDSPLKTVDAAVDGGIVWANAAGNSAWFNWFGAFADSNANDLHDFSATRDECNAVRIELEPLESFTAQLRWDDSWGGADSDLDLYLIPLPESDTIRLSDAVASSEDEQAGGAVDDPFELIRLEYGDIPDGMYCFAVTRYRGAAPNWIQLLVWGAASPLEHYTPDHSITNPAESANPGLLAVGATGRNGGINNPFDTSIIEPFSSRGPTIDGRIKPDIVGADAGQSVTYRSERNPNGYFFGTSQASPHVAGLAALVKQRFPEKNPQQVAQYLKGNAERRGAVPNNTWGYGFAKLPASDATVATPEPTPAPGTATPTPEPTATPAPAPTVPAEVLNRISALETLLTTLQGLVASLGNRIAAFEGRLASLEGRVAALEADASIPTPVPTPTTVPGEKPVPTPTQTPVADACLTSIPSDGAMNGSWSGACTTDRNLITPDAPVGTRYAGYYTFALSEKSEVTITLESSEDTYLFLLRGAGRNGEKAAENDDIDTAAQNYDSRIVETLPAGVYTVVATTYNLASQPGGRGDFTLTVSGIR